MRLRILELPYHYVPAVEQTTYSSTDVPFLVILDEMDGPTYHSITDELREQTAERVGARCVLAFQDRVDLPAVD